MQGIREYELDVAALSFGACPRAGDRAGAGWQARRLAGQGFEVEAVDLAVSNYREVQVFPVTLYDGHHLPFPDGHFDVVYSSSVLEHVPHQNALLADMKRVLQAGGCACGAVRALAVLDPSRALPVCDQNGVEPAARWRADVSGCGCGGNRAAATSRWREALWPARHGERGTAISELYEFPAARPGACASAAAAGVYKPGPRRGCFTWGTRWWVAAGRWNGGAGCVTFWAARAMSTWSVPRRD